jgi:potassium efflux system protein
MQFLDQLPPLSTLFLSLWHFKVFAWQGVPLTVGNLLMAGLFLALSKRTAQKVTGLMMVRFLDPLIEDRSARTTYQRLVFITVFSAVVVLALTMAGIPLTLFTVLGGALAIGVGFGSQNIVNNFISGLILLIERPVKVGDVIEIDSVMGTVVEIGTRSARIKTAENKDWLVPNAFLLEKPILNWSLSAPTVRTQVLVGVAYGSDVSKVRSIFEKIPSQFSFIEIHPKPIVLFEDFAESTLNFVFQFYVNVDAVHSLQWCRSEIRFWLEKKFQEEKIEIAYPQRDLHLRTSRPLEITLKS